jgi:hypothetical protein
VSIIGYMVRIFMGYKGYVIRFLDVRVFMVYGLRVKHIQSNCN